MSRLGVVSGPMDVTAKPAGISVGISPLSDAVALVIEGREPIGLSPQAAFTLCGLLLDACRELMDKSASRPQ